jgi:hypothetical protein
LGVLHHSYIIQERLQRQNPAFSGNSSTQNEDHKRHCSLFSIEHRFPKLDVAGAIPVSRLSPGGPLNLSQLSSFRSVAVPGKLLVD